MTTDNMQNNNTDPKAESQEDAIDWRAKALELEEKANALEAEAAKQRAIKKKAFEQVKELESSKENPEVTKYLKDEVEKLSTQLKSFSEKAKAGAVKVAATSKLTSMGINPDALDLAIQQLDKSMIVYDPETDEVDDTALSAAVSKLKSKHSFLFEKTITTPKFRAPSEGSASGNGKNISLEEWRSMSTREQAAAIKSGKRVV